MVNASSITWNSFAYHKRNAFFGSQSGSAANFPSLVMSPSWLYISKSESFSCALNLMGSVIYILFTSVSPRSFTSGIKSRRYSCVWSVKRGCVGSLDCIRCHCTRVTIWHIGPHNALCSAAALEQGIVACTFTFRWWIVVDHIDQACVHHKHRILKCDSCLCSICCNDDSSLSPI